jgi:hypothetical protein
LLGTFGESHPGAVKYEAKVTLVLRCS